MFLHYLQYLLSKIQDRFRSRVAIIIDCPQKDLFQDLVNVILTSRTAVSEMVVNDNDDDWLLVSAKDQQFWENHDY